VHQSSDAIIAHVGFCATCPLHGLNTRIFGFVIRILYGERRVAWRFAQLRVSFISHNVFGEFLQARCHPHMPRQAPLRMLAVCSATRGVAVCTLPRWSNFHQKDCRFVAIGMR
jgi:hypothetical protein